jgi:hypothetical protein
VKTGCGPVPVPVTVSAVPDTISERQGTRALVCAPEGPVLATEQDALDLIGSLFGSEVDLVVIPVARLDPAFFTLSTGLAGAMLQKFVGYRVQVAIIGDISPYTATSSALRDFVFESNRGRHVWFFADLDQLDARLAGA